MFHFQVAGILLIEKRRVTSRYHGSKIFGSQQYGRRRQRERQKKPTGLFQQNDNFARASRFFAYLLAVFPRLRHEIASASESTRRVEYVNACNLKIF